MGGSTRGPLQSERNDVIKEYDTAIPGKANTGHTFGAELCPDTSGLDPVADRKAIGERLLNSRVGALLAYLKTL